MCCGSSGMLKPKGLAELTSAYLAQYPPRASVELSLAGWRVRVQSNSSELIEWLSRYYTEFLKSDGVPTEVVSALEAPVPELDLPLRAHAPGPGKTRVKDEYCDFRDGRLLRKRLTGMVFAFGAVPGLAVGPCRANANQVVNFVNNRFMRAQIERGYRLCHAAAVADRGRGLLLAGLANRGKSTLALHLLSRGLDFVSNDRLLVKREPDAIRLLGVPKLPRVNPGTLLKNPLLRGALRLEERAELARLPADELWRLERKCDVDIRRIYGAGRFRLDADLSAGVVLTWTRGGGMPELHQANLAERPDLLQAIMKPLGVYVFAGPAALSPAELEAGYLWHLDDCPMYELRGGADFGWAVDRCAALLQAAPACKPGPRHSRGE
jgi:HprK-related kinase B